MRGYTFILWGLLALLALYLFFTLGGREYFDASTRPKRASLWQDSTGAYTAYWEPPDTDNTYSFQLLMSDGTFYTIDPTNKPYNTYPLGARNTIGFSGAVALTDVATGRSSAQVPMNNISAAAGKTLMNAATTSPATTTTTTSTAAPSTAGAAGSPATPPPSSQTSIIQPPGPSFPGLTQQATLAPSSLITGIAGLLLSPDATTIITTGQIPIGDIGQPSQIYEYNNGYAAFAASANLFGDSINKIKADIQTTGNEYNVSVVSDNGVQYTFPLDQITSVTSSTNGDVVAYNLLNTSYPKGNNMFTGNSARTIGIQITMVGPSGSSMEAGANTNQNPLISSISAPNPLAAGVGSTLNAPANAPTYGPAGVGGGGFSGPNGTIPPLAPNTSSTQPGVGCASNTVPKSSLVPCSCATSGSASCSTHQGSTCGSTVPGQPGSSCSDPTDTISSLTKAQRQWDLMKPFNSIMGDVPGYLNSFSAFG
jgi:hypothetical protein